MKSATTLPAAAVRYGRLRSILSQAVHRICPAYLRDDAEDLIQEALLRVYNGDQAQGSHRELNVTYLNRVAYCIMVDELRRRRPESIIVDAQIEQESDPGLAGNPQACATATELGRGIAQCLAQLARARARAVGLYLLGHSVPEVARLLEGTAKATENLVYRGLAQMRKCLRLKELSP